jgi:hypothetical protein
MCLRTLHITCTDMRSQITKWGRLGMNRIIIADCLHISKPRPQSEKHFIHIKCMSRLLDSSLSGQ